MNKQVVPDIIKKTEVLATHEPYKKIWIKEEMPMDDKITAGKNERGTEQKWKKDRRKCPLPDPKCKEDKL